MGGADNRGVGFKYDPVPVSWLKRDVLLFANSIGVKAQDLHFLYELHPSFSVFPTYPVILPFKGTSADIIDFHAVQGANRAAIPGIPKLDSRRVVHGEQSMTFLKPLPPSSHGRHFELRATVTGVYDKGKRGTVVETEHLLVDGAVAGDGHDGHDANVYSRAVGSSFFVGQGGWGGPAGPKAVEQPASALVPLHGEPDAVFEAHATDETALLYRLSGDYNPLHADPEPGEKMGFGGTILHGLWTWNNTAVGLLRVLGKSEPGNIREFAARFASPVKPGDVLVTEAWRMGDVDGHGWESVRFVTKVKGGKVCLSNGRAKMRCAGLKSNL